MKKLMLWMGLMLLGVLMVPAGVFAGIVVDSEDFDGFVFTQTCGSETFIVHSWVEDSPTTGYYRYNYEILEQNVNIQWFSVELLSDAIVSALKPVPSETGDPAMWSVVEFDGSDVSVDAFYISQIIPGQDSTVLWFDSPQPYTIVDGMASGITGGVYRSFEGNLYSPIPEPATMSLLALGAGFVIRRRHKN